MDGRDVIVELLIGIGKMLVYVFLVMDWIKLEQKYLQMVILVLFCELVMQIFQVIQDWKVGFELCVVFLIGGVNVKKQIEKLKKYLYIIVGMSGRVFELIKVKKFKMYEVKIIVLDEMD